MKKLLSLLLALMMLMSTVAVFAEEASEGDSAGEAAATETTDASTGATQTTEAAVTETTDAATGATQTTEAAVTETTEESAGDSATETAAAEAQPDEEKIVTEYVVIPADETTGQVELAYVPANTAILEVDGLKFKDMNDNGELDGYEDWRLDTEERITDLLAQMTVQEKAMLLYHVCTCGDNSGVVFNNQNLYEQNCPYGDAGSSYSMWYYINVYGITTYLDNSNGTPDEQVWAHNEIQAIAENTRLGVPVTFSSDRQYNAWGGYIDTPHDAFATANDPELAAQLWEIYSEATRSIGYHVVLHPYGVELGSWNGEDPAYLAEMTAVEVEAIQNGGMEACTKHFIARGGDFTYDTARSDADMLENWIYPWKAAIEAGTEWIMTNGYNPGISDTVNVDYDKETMDYLRNTLGYDGIVLTDWGAMGNEMSKGVTADGVNLTEFTLAERYAWVINNGVDQMGAPGAGSSEETLAASGPGILSVTALVEAVDQGLITMERLEEAARRILRSKFNLGLFEQPYSDGAAALALSANEAYIAEKWEITDNESLAAARPAELVELERQLMAKSTVLVKNDNNLLPLAQGTKVYVVASSETNANGYKKYIANYGTVVDTIEEADVVVGDFTSINDVAEQTIDDAKANDKTLIITLNCTDPTSYVMEQADAVLFLNFTRGADHGTGMSGFITTMEADVYADLLFGVREPEGMIVREIARDSAMNSEHWQDVSGDMGADTWVKLMLVATTMESETYSAPNNWGDPLLQYQYGMRYGVDADFEYDVLVLPKVTKEVTTESNGSTTTSYESVDGAQAGVPFEVYVLLWNRGGDGVTNVQVKDCDNVIAEKIMAVNGGSWRVVKMEVTIDTAGEHTITVGDLVKTMTVTE